VVQYLVTDLVIVLWLLKRVMLLQLNAINCAVNILNVRVLVVPHELIYRIQYFTCRQINYT